MVKMVRMPSCVYGHDVWCGADGGDDLLLDCGDGAAICGHSGHGAWYMTSTLAMCGIWPLL